MALNSVTDRLSEDIAYIVSRRRQSFDYLKKAHQGRIYFLNVLKLNKIQILQYFSTEKLQKRLRRWSLLGFSFARILEHHSGGGGNNPNMAYNDNNNNNSNNNSGSVVQGPALVRAMAQCVEEYEYYIAMKKDIKQTNNQNNSLNLTKNIFFDHHSLSDNTHNSDYSPLLFIATTSSTPSSPLQSVLSSSAFLSSVTSNAAAMAASNVGSGGSSGGGSGSGSNNSNNNTITADSLKPSLKKLGKEVVYEYLQTQVTTLCDHLDYVEVVCSLCDILSLLYTKFLDSSCSPPLVHEAILKLDRKLKVLVQSKMSNDLVGEIVQPLLKIELKGMLNHMFIDEKISTPLHKKYWQLDLEASAVSSSMNSSSSGASGSGGGKSGASNANTNANIKEEDEED